jgi:hypothetical protein
MSNFIYQTPDKRYAVEEQNDPEWHSVFGDDAIEYLICKYDKSLAEWNKKNKKSHLSDYYIFRSEETLMKCFEWLVKKKIISQEEMKLHESLFGVALDTQKKAW